MTTSISSEVLNKTYTGRKTDKEQQIKFIVIEIFGQKNLHEAQLLPSPAKNIPAGFVSFFYFLLWFTSQFFTEYKSLSH